MRKTLLLMMAVLMAGAVMAQKDIEKTAKAKSLANDATGPDSLKRWFINGTGTLTFSQAAFSNWSAGGENSVGLDAILNLKANYKKGKHAWANTIDLGYGFQILGIGSEADFTKTNDKLELTTAYGYELHMNHKWYLTALVNFKTQFSAGYNYPDDSTEISKFMAPGYLIAGLGITYTPAKWVYFYLSPASVRMTFVKDDTLSAHGQFGVDPGEEIKTEVGPYFRADMNKDLAKNINLATTLELYSDYLEDFGNIDVNWSLMLTMKVNSWLAATVSTQVIYDDNINITNSPDGRGGPKTQFKEMIGIGLSYTIK